MHIIWTGCSGDKTAICGKASIRLLGFPQRYPLDCPVACIPYLIICSPFPHPWSPTSKSPSSPSKPPEALLQTPPPLRPSALYGYYMHSCIWRCYRMSAMQHTQQDSELQHPLVMLPHAHKIQLMHADKCIITTNMFKAERAYHSEC